MATNDVLAHITTSQPDFFVENHGSIMLVRPVTGDARDWLEIHVTGDEHQYFGDALVVEPRYILNLVEGIRGDGLTVGGR